MKRLLLSNDINQLNCLHEFLDCVGIEYGLSAHTMMNLKLALEEAVVNVISYAFSRDNKKEPHAIALELEKTADKLCICLIDDGTAFNPLSSKEPDITLSAEKRPIGGLGIYLVRHLMSEVSYTRTGNKNILRMIKELP